MQNNLIPLYFDALNYIKFFYVSKSFWDLETPKAQVELFSQAALNGGYFLHVFIDAAMKSQEAKEIWMKNKVKQVRKGKMDVPTNVSRTLGELFMKAKSANV